jgi:hypothetical protein
MIFVQSLCHLSTHSFLFILLRARLEQLVSSWASDRKVVGSNRTGQWPYFESHYHQLVCWCQYNVTSRP